MSFESYENNSIKAADHEQKKCNFGTWKEINFKVLIEENSRDHIFRINNGTPRIDHAHINEHET